MAPKDNETQESLAFKVGQLTGFTIRAAVFYWQEAPAQIEREGLNKLTKEQADKLDKLAG
jgi:hypothetical protein